MSRGFQESRSFALRRTESDHESRIIFCSLVDRCLSACHLVYACPASRQNETGRSKWKLRQHETHTQSVTKKSFLRIDEICLRSVPPIRTQHKLALLLFVFFLCARLGSASNNLSLAAPFRLYPREWATFMPVQRPRAVHLILPGFRLATNALLGAAFQG